MYTFVSMYFNPQLLKCNFTSRIKEIHILVQTLPLVIAMVISTFENKCHEKCVTLGMFAERPRHLCISIFLK